MSVTQVWQRLFVGGIGDAKALAESNPLEITTVVTLCRKTVKKFAPRLNYFYFPLPNTLPIPVGRFNAIVNALWEAIRWEKVLVHSLAGASRSPIIAAAWMHAVGYKKIDAALAEIGKMRTVEPNPVLLRSVKEELW